MSGIPPAPSADSDDDARLLKRYFTDGDRDAMGELFRRHADVAYRLAFAHVQNAADAEEIVQTAFLKVLQNEATETTHVRGWLMRIVVNACHDKMKEEKRRSGRQHTVAREAAGMHTPDDARNELTSEAIHAVHALPGKYRLPVCLHYLEGFEFAEVGRALSLPEGTVRSQANRGIEQVRQSLAAAGFTASLFAIPELLAHSSLTPAPATLTSSLKTLLANAAVRTSAQAGGAAAAKSSVAALASSKAAFVAGGALLALALTWTVMRSGRTSQQTPLQKISKAAPLAAETVAEKLLHPIRCTFAECSVAQALASLGEKLHVSARLSPNAADLAAKKTISLNLGDVSGKAALDALAAAAGLKVQVRGDAVVLEPSAQARTAPAPALLPNDAAGMAAGDGNLLQVVDVKLDNLDVGAAAQKLSALYNVNIYFSDAARTDLNGQTIALDLQQLSGIEVLAKLAEKTKTELRIRDGAVVLSRPGEPETPEPKRVGKSQDF